MVFVLEEFVYFGSDQFSTLFVHLCFDQQHLDARIEDGRHVQ